MKLFDHIKKWLSPLKDLWEKETPALLAETGDDIAGVHRRPISPWARRRGKRGRSNHPWVRRDGQRKSLRAPSTWQGVFYE